MPSDPFAIPDGAAEHGAGLVPPPFPALLLSEPPPLPGPWRRPRVWTVFAAIGAGLAGSVVLGVISWGILGAAMAVMGEGQTQETMDGLLDSPWGLILIAVVGQSAFLAAAVGAAWWSPSGMRARLGLVRGRVTPWAVPVFMAGTVFVMFNSMILAGMLLGGPSEEMEDFSTSVAESSGFLAVLVLLAISVLPGFTEELLFRGYAQRRLIERWGPAAGIGVTSVVFAAAHIDWMHAATVLPLGVWLGVIAWRTGAVWPGMACHFGNNFLAVILAQMFGGAEAGKEPSGPVAAAFFGAWLLTGMAFVGSVLVLVFAARRDRPLLLRHEPL